MGEGVEFADIDEHEWCCVRAELSHPPRQGRRGMVSLPPCRLEIDSPARFRGEFVRAVVVERWVTENEMDGDSSPTEIHGGS